MPIVAKLDELGKPAWIALAILGFMVWWPVGLATLAFIMGSGRMSLWKGSSVDRWHGAASQMRPAGTWWQPARSSVSILVAVNVARLGHWRAVAVGDFGFRRVRTRRWACVG
jgi:hypothetical protein